MHRHQHITWTKLSLDLQSLSPQEPASLASILIGISAILDPQGSPEGLNRALNFMIYELSALSTDLGAESRFHLLNDYFFNRRGFRNRSLADAVCPLMFQDLVLLPVLTQKMGHPIVLAVVYNHLATQLDLPIYIVNSAFSHLLKWVKAGQNCYVDLTDHGRLVPEIKLAHLVNQHCGGKKSVEVDSLEILPGRQVAIQYLNLLMQLFETGFYQEKLLFVYSVFLEIEPNNLSILSRRALLYRKMRLNHEALADLRRYFSFIERSQASPELQIAFLELQNLVNPSSKINLASLYLH
ncbi:MAG: hypothetical protein IPL83_19215 [Bdellovibrionales bacterium]|nr:hypothetical protein [Bdellovibrionales bacterium]